MPQLILASQSPRRQEILAKLDISFEVIPSQYEEDMSLDLPATELVQVLAQGKAAEVSERYPEAIVIGSDTFVTFEGKFLGKPLSEDEAREMLQMLQGQVNQIVTGVCVMQASSGKTETFVETVDVWMASMSETEIAGYVATGEPMDKAGAYALQEKGGMFIEKIEGEFFAAMGLPLRRVALSLRNFGVTL